MSQRVQDLLKKINYIEADLEIHKQILFSIPSAERSEMEQVMKVIAEKKEMVNDLRDQIRFADPIEFERIVSFENAAAEFKKIAAEKKFREVFTLNGNESCTISLKNGSTVECLVKAQDQTGEWTILTLDAKIINIPGDEVMA